MARIAVDAMGGDHAPSMIVAGAVQAAAQVPGIEHLYLVGDRSVLERELATCGRVPDHVEIVHASEVIAMEESPATAVRRKKDSSIGRAVDLVKAGKAEAIFSAGNTGAAVAATTLKLRTLEGITRPAIATAWPTPLKPFVLLDAGATTDCSADLLCQFAVMGTVYARDILGIANPQVGLMSIGEEDAKGNEVTRDAFRKLESSPVLNFKGNIEGHDLWSGAVDVAVCDGFVGNVILKTSESTARAVNRWFVDEIRSKWSYRLGALLCRNAFVRVRRKTNPAQYGGAPLLGVNGICIIGHGSSTQEAARNGVRVACESVQHEINPHIVNDMKAFKESVVNEVVEEGDAA